MLFTTHKTLFIGLVKIIAENSFYFVLEISDKIFNNATFFKKKF